MAIIVMHIPLIERGIKAANKELDVLIDRCITDELLHRKVLAVQHIKDLVNRDPALALPLAESLQVCEPHIGYPYLGILKKHLLNFTELSKVPHPVYKTKKVS
jgi:hypothetical protein